MDVIYINIEKITYGEYFLIKLNFRNSDELQNFIENRLANALNEDGSKRYNYTFLITNTSYSGGMTTETRLYFFRNDNCRHRCCAREQPDIQARLDRAMQGWV